MNDCHVVLDFKCRDYEKEADKRYERQTDEKPLSNHRLTPRSIRRRMDAVNIVDTDVAVITSIDIDHKDWLGDNREAISQEKLGIARFSRPLILCL